MFEYVMIGLVVLLVVGVGIYRHYKGDDECCLHGTTDYCELEPGETVKVIRPEDEIRPEIVEMCKAEN